MWLTVHLRKKVGCEEPSLTIFGNSEAIKLNFQNHRFSQPFLWHVTLNLRNFLLIKFLHQHIEYLIAEMWFMIDLTCSSGASVINWPLWRMHNSGTTWTWATMLWPVPIVIFSSQCFLTGASPMILQFQVYYTCKFSLSGEWWIQSCVVFDLQCLICRGSQKTY